MKVQIQFKNPDMIFEIINGKHPLPDDEDDITPRMENDREAFSKEYFEFGDYGRFEIDTGTMAARLVPRSEWQ